MKTGKKDSDRNQMRKKQWLWKLEVLSGGLLCAAAFVVGGFAVFSISGKYNLEKQAVSYAQERNVSTQVSAGASEGKDTLQAGQIRRSEDIRQIEYEGHTYCYDEDIFTFLLIGTDREKMDNSGEHMDGARTEALSLVVLDHSEKAVKLIPISCNTMITMEVYDGEGSYAGTVAAQVGVRHGFEGDDRASCEYQIKAVQDLFYGIPINGYLAADMDLISEAVALMGELDVRASEEVSAERSQEGQIHLLAELISEGIRALRKNPASVTKAYHQISDRIFTDITADEMTYLVAAAGSYRFDVGEILIIPGTNANGGGDVEGGYNGFYVDEEAFYRLVLDIFYKPVG